MPYLKKAALIFGSDTGMTEEVTYDIVEKIDFLQVEVKEVNTIDKNYFENFDNFILGLSTWYDGDLQSDWEDFYEEFQTIDFTNKRVAIYGLGDQYGYHQYFIDGVGILAKVIIKNGGEILGFWPTTGYDFSASKAVLNETFFYGLAIDEDNEPELTQDRINDWVAQLRTEFNESNS